MGARAEALGSPAAALSRHISCEPAELEVEQPGVDLALTCDADLAGSSLNCYATTLAPKTLIYNLPSALLGAWSRIMKAGKVSLLCHLSSVVPSLVSPPAMLQVGRRECKPYGRKLVWVIQDKGFVTNGSPFALALDQCHMLKDAACLCRVFKSDHRKEGHAERIAKTRA